MEDPRRYPRDKEKLLREVDMALRLGEIRRSHRLRELLAPTWWEPVLVVVLFMASLGLLASLFQYARLREGAVERWTLFWFALMILVLVLCFQVILLRLYHLRRANEHAMRALEDLRRQSDAVARSVEALEKGRVAGTTRDGTSDESEREGA